MPPAHQREGLHDNSGREALTLREDQVADVTPGRHLAGLEFPRWPKTLLTNVTMSERPRMFVRYTGAQTASPYRTDPDQRRRDGLHPEVRLLTLPFPSIDLPTAQGHARRTRHSVRHGVIVSGSARGERVKRQTRIPVHPATTRTTNPARTQQQRFRR